jgi:hypothetical protein
MSDQKNPPMVYLRGGHVCGFTVPLPPAVVDRWKRGHLQRVTEDGRTWPGDPWVMPGDEPGPDAPDDGDGETGGTGRPKGSAAKADWVAYAVSLGACTEDEAGKLTRDQLVELCTAPEDKPGEDS